MVIVMNAFSQAGDNTITLNKKRYYQAGQKLDGKQLKTILSNNPASQPEYNYYKKHNAIAAPFLIGASACFLGSATIMLSSSIKQSNDLNNGTYSESYPSGLGLLGLGLVSAVVGVVISIPGNEHFRNSVNQYNLSLNKTGYYPVRVNLNLYANGMGVRVVF